MPNINYITCSFTSGELSPQIEGRVDLAKYQSGAATLNNVFVRVYGGAYRRPGTYLASVTKLSTAAVRVIPFEFSTTQAYIIEAGHQYFRFYKDSGILTSGTPVEISTVYDSGSLFHLQYAQDADTMYVTHSAHPVRKLTRSSHYLWSLAEVDFVGGPWMPSNFDSSAYIKSSSFSAGAALITTSGNTTFVSGHSGAFLRVGISNGYVRLNSVSSLSAQATVVNELRQVAFTGDAWMPSNTHATAYVKSSSYSIGATNITFSGNTSFIAEHSSTYLRVGNSNGYVLLNTVSSNSAQATVINALQSVSATVLTTSWAHGAGFSWTTDWSHGAWSVENGYPTALSFFEQRLYFGGTPAEPQTLWGSVPLSYENFTPGSNDDDAVSFTIADNQVNAIKWLAAGRYLAVGTQGGNFVLNTDTSSGPVTPTNINVKKETTYGSALLLPKRIGNALLYLQRDNITLRELKYNFEEDALLADDATILSQHITESGVKDMEYQEAPDGILWCVRNDGKLATMTRLVSQDVLSWTRHDTQGSYQSIAIIPSGNEDQVWTVAQRSNASVNAKYIEYFKPFIQPNAQSSSFYVDCGLSYESGTTAGVASVSGLDHLEGLTVSILGDGSVFPNTVVSDGTVTISQSCSSIHVGLPYTSVIKSCRLESGDVTSSTQGIIKRIYKSIIRLWRSLGCSVGNETTQDIVMFRDSSMPMDVAPPLYTGDKEISFPVGWNKRAQVFITQSQPLPLNCLAIISKIEVSTD